MLRLVEAVVSGLAQGSVYALLGLGFVIVFKATDVVNFATPALMIFGAYFTSYFALDLDLPFVAAVPLAMAVVAVLGSVTERITMRPMIGEPVFSAAMVTVGVFFALNIVAGDLIGLQPRTVGDPWGLSRVSLGGIGVAQVDLVKIVVTAVVVAVVAALFKYTRVGLAMRATAFDQETALAQGINVGRMFNLSWALAGALAALAGVFVGTGSGYEITTALVALKALPAIILGGLDSITGAIVGGLVIGVVEALTGVYQPSLAPWLGANFDQVMPYIVMLVVLLVRPYGLFGTPEIERV